MLSIFMSKIRTQVENGEEAVEKSHIVFITLIICNLSGSDLLDQTTLIDLEILQFFNFLFKNNLNEFSNKNILITLNNLLIGNNPEIIKEVTSIGILENILKLCFNYNLDV